MRRLFRENGLSIVMFGLFLIFMVGQCLTGMNTYNQEQKDHHQPPVSLGGYLHSPHFIEGLTENWESEFLQMGMYVVLTAFLFQKGSAESRPLDEDSENPDQERSDPKAPWAARQGGVTQKLYAHSLSIALFTLFALSFAGHVYGSYHVYNEDQLAHGQPPESWIQYLGSSRLWFESFQNWQSEFLAVFSLSVLSIWLRERNSSQSKPVAAPHAQTGD